MPKSYAQLVQEAKAALANISPDELKARLDRGEELLLIDVREPQEWRQGTLPGAQTVARGVLEGQIDGRVPYDASIVLYCGSGARSALAGKSLKEMGFEEVANLEEGFMGWARRGYPVQPPRL